MVNSGASLLNELGLRGLVSQVTSGDELARHLDSAPRTLYCGFDPTADSLHIGSLVPLLALRRFQLAGHRPIALVGGATGMIGDPSFKSKERKLNTPEVTEAWTERIRQQVSRFIDFECGANAALVANNLDWTKDLSVLTFLRDTGKHFSVNAMIQKESVRQRIDRDGEGISFTEFTYMILQAMDFAVLNERHGCTLQIGGSDQWGNITAGIDLARRQNQQQVYGLTLPLVTKADGGKFGKTEEGTIWLDPAKTSCYAFYQFWMNTADADVYKFLGYFTFLSPTEIKEIEEADKSREGRPMAQAVLAREVTKLVHGEQGLQAAERISQALFSGDVSGLTRTDFEQLRQDGLPTTRLGAETSGLVGILVASGLASSNRAAREFISNGAVSVNDRKVLDHEAVLQQDQALFGKYWLLRRGKKQFHLVFAD